MCKLMEDLIRDDRLDTAKKLIANGKLSYEEIAETYDLPLSTVEELASKMQKKAGA